MPLLLSTFIHLWNPIGFPAVWVVEDQYMHRTLLSLGIAKSSQANNNRQDLGIFSKYQRRSKIAIRKFTSHPNRKRVPIES
jgi:hypothetical protein